MLYIKRLLTVLLPVVLLCGCGCVKENTNSESADLPEKSITVNGRVFTVEEIKEGIGKTLNNILYYSNNLIWLDKESILHKNLEYDLFYIPSIYDGTEKADYFHGLICLVITNVLNPYPSGSDPQLCVYGIGIKKWGLQSDFFYGGRTEKEKPYFLPTSGDFGETAVFLGSHSIRIDEIKTPKHEQMDDTWKESVKKEVQLYMDNSDTLADITFMSPGKYNVYIMGFFESDDDTYIYFENENGDIYRGLYYFIHNVSKHTESWPADLNHVERAEGADIDVFERVRANAVLSFEVIKK